MPQFKNGRSSSPTSQRAYELRHVRIVDVDSEGGKTFSLATIGNGLVIVLRSYHCGRMECMGKWCGKSTCGKVNGETRRLFRRYCERNHLAFKPLDNYSCQDGTFRGVYRDGKLLPEVNPGRTDETTHLDATTFLVVGTPVNLAKLCYLERDNPHADENCERFIREYHFPLDLRLPSGSGTGELTQSASKKLKAAKAESRYRAGEKFRARVQTEERERGTYAPIGADDVSNLVRNILTALRIDVSACRSADNWRMVQEVCINFARQQLSGWCSQIAPPTGAQVENFIALLLDTATRE